jgi:hypothetical protein
LRGENHYCHLAFVRRCVDLGCRMLSLGMDVWAVQKGLRTFKSDYIDLFPQAVVSSHS